MKKHSKKICRFFSMLLVLLMLFSMIAAIPFTSEAATTTKNQKKYEIAVVFDNSRSMYIDTDLWCKAKYAMEIFASMLNYDNGDKLEIFTMHDVTTDAAKTGAQTTGPIEIKSLSDIDKISYMYTPKGGGTPYTPVSSAQNYLQTKASKDAEKWLIVLTDGAFDGYGENNKDELRNALIGVAKSGIKVQYLGIGDSAFDLSASTADEFYAKKSSGNNLQSDLVDICNSIFQRTELSGYLNGKDLELDLSMKNLVVFVQGKGAKINSLTDSSGKQINKTQDSKQRKFSELTYAIGTSEGQKADGSLYGQVVTFDSCPKGKYTLNTEGAERVQIFYEPDVDLRLTLTNSDGEEVDWQNGDLYTGDYTFTTALVDSVTGEDVTSHKLMGNVDIHTRVKTSDAADHTEYPNGGKISLVADDATEILIEGTYLTDYTISSKDDPRFNIFFPIIIKDPKATLVASAEVLQKGSKYKTAEHADWKPIKVTVKIDGQPVSEEQMNSMKLDVAVSDDIKWRCEPNVGESAYYIYIADDNGSYAEPKAGTYELTATVTYTDRYGEESADTSKVTFEILAFELGVNAKVVQDMSWYSIHDHDSWKPVKIYVTKDGQPLTDDQMKNAVLTVNLPEEISWQAEIAPGESAFNVYIGRDEAGNFVEPETGKYTLQATVAYTSEAGDTATGTDKASFRIEPFSSAIIKLITALGIAAAIAIITFILTRKAWPHKMTCNFVNDGETRRHSQPIKIQQNMLLIPMKSAVTVKAEKNSMLIHKFSRKASIKVTFTNANAKVDSFTISGMQYGRDDGFNGPGGAKYSSTITGSCTFAVEYNDGTPAKTGTIKIN